MAGHSKWANIQHRKKAQDNKRGKLFTKLIREITVAARMGGGDASSNPRLRAAIDKALAGNMTRDTIDRAVKRGTGELEGVSYEEIRYEGYGPEGVAIMVDCLTDNHKRTVAEVRHAFSKFGGNMGTDGSVAYLFTKLGLITLAPGADEDDVMECALESGAEDVELNDDGSIDVVTTVADLDIVKDALESAQFEVAFADVVMKASTEVDISDSKAESLMKLLGALEDLDDVQYVYSNADISDVALENFG